MFMRNLFGQDLGALNATRWPHSSAHITHSADAMLKFLLRCLPQGFRPKGLSHSYVATAIAVMLSEVKTAIHSSVLNGSRKANSGISERSLGAARKLTPPK